MTVNAFVRAVAGQLRETWPDRNVYDGQVPRDADGNYFVRAIETSGGKRLGRRRQRTYQFEVLYCLREDDPNAFRDWADTMYDLFETLPVTDETGTVRLVHLSNQQARDGDDKVYRFSFDAAFTVLYAQDAGDEMDAVTIEEATIT